MDSPANIVWFLPASVRLNPLRVPPGRHRSPAVGGVFVRGVHLLPRRSAAPVGRSLRQHGVRVPRPHRGDPRLHHQQVSLSCVQIRRRGVVWVFKVTKIMWSVLQGSVRRCNGVGRRPGEVVLPPKTWSVKREEDDERFQEKRQQTFHNQTFSSPSPPQDF